MSASLGFAPKSAIPTKANEPNPTTKGSTSIGSLKICKNLNEIRQSHCNLIKNGFSYKISSVTKLIIAYAEMATPESLGYARKAFSLYEKDEGAGTLFMYNTLIRGYSSAGLCEEAIFLYLEMAVKGVVPDKFTYPFVLSACTKVTAFCEGTQLHGAVIKMGLEQDVFIENSLIHFYGECKEIDYARKVFDEMTVRNVVSWTSLICGYARRDYPKEAVSLFFEMVEAGIQPNSVTMVCVISACAKLQDLELGERVSSYIGKSDVKLNSLMVNALVDMYMKCGTTDTAKQLFDECHDRNLVLYNTFMSNYVQQGLMTEALATLKEMLRQGERPDRVTMLSAISACAQLDDLLSGKQCHGYVLRNGLECWDSICNAMIDMYMKCGEQETASTVFDRMVNKTVVSWNSLVAGFIRNGDAESAWKIFNEMPESNLVSWNTIIDALVQESMFDKAIEVFRVMQIEGVKADNVTMVSLASACGYLGSIDLAKWIHTYIKKNDINCDMLLSTALVDMFGRCGDPQSAIQVFSKMAKKDVSSWTAAIRAMTMEGNSNRAIEHFHEMLRQGVKPDAVVFVQLLTACSHGGLVEQGWQLFTSMQEIHEISPQVVHYGCMVDLLSRARLFEEALNLIKSMPMEPNDVIWGSLLASCRTHNNIEMAAYAAERIAEFSHKRTGIQVLLSNIYASAGKWSDVAKIRLHMNEKGVKKVPGASSIEVNGMVHEFTSGDESHPTLTHIVPMLTEINSRLMDVGHVPDLPNALLNIDE